MKNITSTALLLAFATTLSLGVSCSDGSFFGGKQEPQSRTDKDSGEVAEQPTEVTGAFLCASLPDRKSEFNAQTDEMVIGCQLPPAAEKLLAAESTSTTTGLRLTSDSDGSGSDDETRQLNTAAESFVTWPTYTSLDGNTRGAASSDIVQHTDPTHDYARIFVIPTLRVKETLVTAYHSDTFLGETWLGPMRADFPASFRLYGTAFPNTTMWWDDSLRFATKTRVNPETFCDYAAVSSGSPLKTTPPQDSYLTGIAGIISGILSSTDNSSYMNKNAQTVVDGSGFCFKNFTPWGSYSRYKSATQRTESPNLTVGYVNGKAACYIGVLKTTYSGDNATVFFTLSTAEYYGAGRGTDLSPQRMQAVVDQYRCK
jgi:hypothetical protein